MKFLAFKFGTEFRAHYSISKIFFYCKNLFKKITLITVKNSDPNQQLIPLKKCPNLLNLIEKVAETSI
jgi:hypothetical protein